MTSPTPTPPGNPPAAPGSPGKNRRQEYKMAAPVVTGPLAIDIDSMTQTCYDNHRLYSELALAQPIGKYPMWPAPTMPPGWKEHPGCEICKTFQTFIHYQPPTTRHACSKDPNQEYAFTLTMPPDYTPAKPIEEVVRLIMEKGLTNKPYEKASSWAFVLEHTEKGTPHVHGVYRTQSGRRIATKYFNRYWPLWDEKVKMGLGHKGGYHSPARHSESYAAYIEKEGVVIKSPA